MTGSTGSEYPIDI